MGEATSKFKSDMAEAITCCHCRERKDAVAAECPKYDSRDEPADATNISLPPVPLARNLTANIEPQSPAQRSDQDALSRWWNEAKSPKPEPSPIRSLTEWWADALAPLSARTPATEEYHVTTDRQVEDQT
mmetsp:Transcript_12623/g.21973  ORF Transcript_12623/g.21973 Transcript_12623/m.21973 type:complete len:130 (+) Transcript_12623:63-452(+)